LSEPAVVGERVADHLAEFFRRLDIALPPDSPVGCTLSAGLDSRTVLAAGIRALPGRITAITGAPDANPELSIARTVATAAGVRHETAFWDSAVLVDRFRLGRGLLVGSHHRWTDAHFSGASKLFTEKVVVGGYFSDAMIDHNDGQLAMRRKAIASGALSEDSHWSITSPHFFALDGRTRRRIRRRAEANGRSLGSRYAGVEHLRLAMPSGRGLYSAHWMALHREWAQYEPFLTEDALALSLASSELPGPGSKPGIFAAILADGGLSGIPVNPAGPTNEPGRPWLDFKAVTTATPGFVEEYRLMQQRALVELRIGNPAVRMRHLLVNVYWAGMILAR
jgi:hypothetical protein